MSKPRVFLREATGLVREIGWFDAFQFNVIGIGAATALQMGLTVGPLIGGDPTLIMLIAAVSGIFVVLVYYMLTVTMPRSGGDYVFISRILHPSLGFMGAGIFLFLNVYFIGGWGATGWVASGVSPVLSYVGALYNIPVLRDWAAALVVPVNTAIIGLVTIALFALLMIIKGRWFYRINNVLLVYATLMAFVMLALFVSTSQHDFTQLFDSYAGAYGTSSADIIATATAAGWSLPERTLYTSLLSSVCLFQSWYWIVSSTTFGGEIKSPRSSQLYGMIACVIFWGLAGGILYVSVFNMVGYPLLSAAAYLSLFQPAQWRLPVPPYMVVFASVVAKNPYLAVIIGFSTVFPVMLTVPWSMTIFTRYAFALSFDRMLPSSISDVSDKYHSLAKALIVSAVLGTVVMAFAILPTTASYIFFLTWGMSLSSMTVMLLASVAAIALPYRRRELYETASAIKAKLAGIPIISVVGALSAVFLLIGIGTYLSLSKYTGLTPESTAAQFGVMIFFFALYFVIKYYRRSRGIDITAAFAEIPPE